MIERRNDPGSARVLARLLQAGIAAGVVLIVAGGVRCALDGGLGPGIGIGVTGFGVTGVDGPSLLRLGIFAIILTPILRVVALAILFVRTDDRTGVVWAIAVLLLLILATVLNVSH